jgi:glycosyltransferase involved in cell wall biosynthesis
MPKVSDIFVSAVLVADQNATGVAGKVERIRKLLHSSYANYEILVIDNGIKIREFNKLEELLPKLPGIRVIRLAKAYDTDTAVFAGIDAAIGDFVCTLYNQDPEELIEKFVDKAREHDIIFGVAINMRRKSRLEGLGARLFYWYSRRSLKIDIPNGSTFFICLSRSAVNALTRSGRFSRHIRHMAKQVGFRAVDYRYSLPKNARVYSNVGTGAQLTRAIDLSANYSSHPLRSLTYFGIIGGILNIIYAGYVVVVNLTSSDIAKGWTTLSLQSSLMFFLLFIILAVLAEYTGKILSETQNEPAYHIAAELDSKVGIARETRRNVTRRR